MRKILRGVCVMFLSCGALHAQTPSDAVMMKQFEACFALMYDQGSWDHYWEGSYLRTNGNVGTFSRRMIMPMIAIGLHDREDGKAELGYWIAKPFWNNGFVTEAAKVILDFGFKELYFNKIFATHFPHNPASGKIMEKIGMQKESVLKQHIKKGEEYYDIVMYSIVKK